MKRLLIIIASAVALFACADTLPRVVLSGRVNYNYVEPAAPPTYLVKQGFEGTGYDNSETWTTGAGSPNADGTTAFVGAQSLHIDTTAAAENAYTSFTSRSNAWVKFSMFIAVKDTSTRTIAELRNVGTAQGALVLLSSGELRVGSGSATESTTGVVPTNQWVHVWWYHQKGAASLSDGFSTAGFSTNISSMPTNGNNFVAMYDGIATNDVSRLYFGSGVSGTQSIYFDEVRLDDVAIPSNPQ